MKKAIVTGATGFIGKYLIRELLTKSVEVIALVRANSSKLSNIPSNVRIVECNLDQISYLPKLVEDRDIDVVFHTSWQGVADLDARDELIQIMNVTSTLELIEAVHNMKINTIVGCGSIQEMEAWVEMNFNQAIDSTKFFYKASKLYAHMMGKAKAGSYGIRFFWPLINTYGEEELAPRLINMIIRKIFKNESPSLSLGNQYYDFVHVKDVARALYLIAEKGVDGTNYTIASGDCKPLKNFLTVVGEIANEINGTSIPLGFGEIVDDVISLPREVFDIDNLRRDTGFGISIRFEEGIRKTALWIKEHG